MTSLARRCDVTEFLKLSSNNRKHIVLTHFGVRNDSRFVIDVLYKKSTKLLTDPRIYIYLNVFALPEHLCMLLTSIIVTKS